MVKPPRTPRPRVLVFMTPEFSKSAQSQFEKASRARITLCPVRGAIMSRANRSRRRRGRQERRDERFERFPVRISLTWGPSLKARFGPAASRPSFPAGESHVSAGRQVPGRRRKGKTHRRAEARRRREKAGRSEFSVEPCRASSRLVPFSGREIARQRLLRLCAFAPLRFLPPSKLAGDGVSKGHIHVLPFVFSPFRAFVMKSSVSNGSMGTPDAAGRSASRARSGPAANRPSFPNRKAQIAAPRAIQERKIAKAQRR